MDIFGLDPKVNGVFSGTNFKLTLGGSSASSAAGALIQSFQVGYARQVSRIYELGSRNQYYIEGNTEGQGTVAGIVGPTALVDNIFKNLVDICQTRNNTLTLAAGNKICGFDAGTSNDTSIKLKYCTATNLTMGGSAQNFVFNRAYGLMFASLEA